MHATAPTPAPPPTPTGETVAELHVLEQRRPFSESSLWELQRRFYDAKGADAWGTGGVPHYITCNPYIADAYARTVLAFLRDCRAAGSLPEGGRTYIVELGSGSGRFAYQFTTRLQQLLQSSNLHDVAATVVMTDFTATNTEAWRRHPRMQDLFTAGRLDVAQFDASAPGPLELAVSGVTLASEAVEGPVIVLGNYVLDSLPNDAITVSHGAVHRTMVTLTADRGDVSLDDDDALSRVDIHWEAVDASDPLYQDEELEELVRVYGAQLDDTTVLLPTAAIGAIRYLTAATSGPSLCLFADKGFARTRDLLAQPTPQLVDHGGCFSVMVNFDALCRFTEGRGGRAFRPRHRPGHLPVVGLAYGVEPESLRETAQAYTDHLESAGPDDFYTIKSILGHIHENMSLEQALAYLRLTRWDPHVLLESFPVLLDLVEDAPESLYPDVHAALCRTWDQHFPIEDDGDVALTIGLLLSAIRYHREALEFFERSVAQRGPSATASFGTAMVHYGLRDLGSALKHVEEALEIDPAYTAARTLRTTLQDQLPAGS